MATKRTVTLKSPVGLATAIVTDEKDHLQACWRRGVFYEAPMLEHIWCAYPGSTFVDCGSAIGNHTLFFAKLCVVDTVLSIEPVRKSFDLQREVLELNGVDNVILCNSAMSDKPGKGRMEKLQARPWNQGMWRLVESAQGQVDVTTIDECVRLYGLEQVDLIKIDVEFSECKVLTGAMRTLERDHPVVFVEVTEATAGRVKKMMGQLGYKQMAVWNASPTLEFVWMG